ncbi:uncharacterized protein B0I36DRAFT_428239 [Microdochium trichocladiopsis]|uniref:Uncharacterized protein n=1 Tax=Microdochium trichocladiopsis TaxID=1682393 RepID=A0A9P8YDW1_9PEZI|nr:uncharacterized protein B0I36DRAFT_428239 [Microdochium trichocladiopsis]KAH7037655.1 hypothetical protein B0I36DRAFT_428239 [Microdochium trichocladiopsis]
MVGVDPGEGSRSNESAFFRSIASSPSQAAADIQPRMPVLSIHASQDALNLVVRSVTRWAQLLRVPTTNLLLARPWLASSRLLGWSPFLGLVCGMNRAAYARPVLPLPIIGFLSRPCFGTALLLLKANVDAASFLFRLSIGLRGSNAPVMAVRLEHSAGSSA